VDKSTVVDDSTAFGRGAPKWLYTVITRAENDLTVVLRCFTRERIPPCSP